ncbi:MAG: zinc ribbon domain-containing protein [Gemmatimonadetes bacterium]|nr:zinc ribbon domain-containing protein [Gemmatimonadota bacterium]NNK63051.1 zinc ribbon domain-containing protein [Gemmatimonadota bacterium]
MPTFDYRCGSCGAEFEEWVKVADTSVPCPECGAAEAERQLSIPIVHSSTTRAKSMRSAKRRDDSQQYENMKVRQEYEANHDD